MKLFTAPTTQRNQSAWGRDLTVTEARYSIEACDVGHTRPHYLGYNHRQRTFVPADIGMGISVLTMQGDPAWTCWSFTGEKV